MSLHICEPLSNQLKRTSPMKRTSSMLLPTPTPDISDYAQRDKLPTLSQLVHFNEHVKRGKCNYRDGVVLGNHPGISIPENFKQCQKVLLTFYLHHPMDARAHATFLSKYVPPVFVKKSDQDIDDRFRNKHPIGSHQTWIIPQHSTVHWKKRKWTLSRTMRTLAGCKHPKYVIVLTPTENGIIMYNKSVRTTAFEVCSKEQPKQSNFERGVTEEIKRRRTPETERAEMGLRALQTDILSLQDEIKTLKTKKEQYNERLQFAQRYCQVCGQEQLLRNIEKFIQKFN